MPTPNELSTADKLVVPDHENPSWLRAKAASLQHSMQPRAVAHALSLLADLLDVCGREDVIVLPPNRAMHGTEWTIWSRGDNGPLAHGPTLPAAVRAFRAAEQEAAT